MSKDPIFFSPLSEKLVTGLLLSAVSPPSLQWWKNKVELTGYTHWRQNSDTEGGGRGNKILWQGHWFIWQVLGWKKTMTRIRLVHIITYIILILSQLAPYWLLLNILAFEPEYSQANKLHFVSASCRRLYTTDLQPFKTPKVHFKMVVLVVRKPIQNKLSNTNTVTWS